MSGGEFNYIQHNLEEVAEQIAGKAECNHEGYSNDTIQEFRQGLKAVRRAIAYIHEIDWLLSGDTGEESFHKRLKQKLLEL